MGKMSHNRIELYWYDTVYSHPTGSNVITRYCASYSY